MDVLGEAVATSQPVVVSQRTWDIALWAFPHQPMLAYATVFRPLDDSTVLMVWDLTEDRSLKTCVSGMSCQVKVPKKGDRVRAFVVPVGHSDPRDVHLAASDIVAFPTHLYAPNSVVQDCGGDPCTGDPVFPSNGGIYEGYTDISVKGNGPDLRLTRTYSSPLADAASRFGFGWSGGYDMRIVAVPGADGSVPTSLSDAANVVVVQQNGSSAPFSRQADGSFTTPTTVLASLEQNADGTYMFIQRGKSVFTFDAYGKLIAEKDLHGNATILSYDGFGRLVAVTDASKRTLTYSYDGGLVTKVVGPGGRAETYSYDGKANLVSATDATGATWRYSYDDAHQLLSLTDPDGYTTSNTFDGMGRVVAQTDGRGMTTSYEYRADGSCVVTHPAGDVTTFVYTEGLLTERVEGAGADAAIWQYRYEPTTLGLAQVTDPEGRVISMSYDLSGNLISITDATGSTSHFTYDELDDETSVTDADGHTTTIAYNGVGDLLSVTDPMGAVTSYTYDSFGNRLTATDPDGHTSVFGYDKAGDLTSATDPVGATTTMAVDGLGQTTAVTDPLGRTTSYTYDARGLLTSVTNPNDETTSYGYDAASRRTSVTDATGRTWTYAYDEAGNPVRVSDPDGSFVATGYDADGRKASVSDAAGNTTSYAYDARGDLTSSTDPTGAVTTYAHDKAGLLTSTTSPNGGVTSFGYDDDGRTTSVTDPVGGMSHTAYDRAGRVTSTVDPSGNTTGYSYDADGRVTLTTRADGSFGKNFYDPAGLLLSYTDAAGHTTSYGYDADARRTTSTDPVGRTTRFGYDAASRLVSGVDAAGRVTTSSYDAAGRLVGVDYTDPNTPDVSYAYDGAGRRTSMSDGTGTTSYTYDTAGRLVSVANPATGVAGYGYDGLGRVARVTYPDGRMVVRSYDGAGRLESVDDGTGLITRFTYDGDGNLVATTYPNGVVQQQVFDPADRLTSTAVNNGGATLASFAYQMSPTGLATVVNTTGSADVAPASQGYSYDKLLRLADVSTNDGATAPSGSFGFDPAGNVTALPDGTALSYDAASQLTGSVGPGAIPTGYGFDQVGDRTAQTTGGLTSTYGYDQAPQLTSVNVPGRSPYHLMAGGEFFSLAVRGDGSVRAWGDNRYGQLGDAGACGTYCPTEITVPGLPTVLQVAAGRNHALAVATNGRVFAWGSNDHGQLGNTTTTDFATPEQVPGLRNVVSVAAGDDSSYALTRDGRVYAWGENDQGQLGDGTMTDSATPVLVRDLPPVVDVSAGALPDGPTHVLAATADGHVYTWGDAGPHPADPTQAHDASAGSGNRAVHANASSGSGCKTDNGAGNGGVPGGGHDNGHASGCPTGNGIGSAANGNGNNAHGALLAPVLVDGVDQVVQVAAGGSSSYALTSAGTVFTWGTNHYGQLGLGTPPSAQTVDRPTEIIGLPSIKMVAAGGAHALALSTRGQVFGWGDDNTGQVGTPTQHCREDGKVCPAPHLINGVTASAVTAGYAHSLIATVYEKVDGLGRDAEGELGDGYTHPATQVGPAGDRNALDTPDGGAGGAKFDLTHVTGLGQVRPQASVRATYTYTGDGLRATSSATVDDTTTVVPVTTTNTYTWDTQAAIPALLADGVDDYVTGPGGIVVEQTGVLGKASTSGTVFLHADRLGTTRLLTNTAGQTAATFSYTPTGVRVQADGLALLPYAEGIPSAQGITPFGYAGSYTDLGTGSFYLRARYDDPNTDQFLTVDPLIDATRATYNYAGSDAVNNTDPTGYNPALGECEDIDYGQGGCGRWLTGSGAQPGLASGYVAALESCPLGSQTFFLIMNVILMLPTDGEIEAVDAAVVAERAAARSGEQAAEDSSALARASRLANDAADNADSWSISAKHLPGAAGRWAKFGQGVDPQATVEQALRSPDAHFFPNPSGSPGSFIVRTDLGQVIGFNGETAVKVVVSGDGRIITAYPVK